MPIRSTITLMYANRLSSLSQWWNRNQDIVHAGNQQDGKSEYWKNHNYFTRFRFLQMILWRSHKRILLWLTLIVVYILFQHFRHTYLHFLSFIGMAETNHTMITGIISPATTFRTILLRSGIEGINSVKMKFGIFRNILKNSLHSQRIINFNIDCFSDRICVCKQTPGKWTGDKNNIHSVELGNISE